MQEELRGGVNIKRLPDQGQRERQNRNRASAGRGEPVAPAPLRCDPASRHDVGDSSAESEPPQDSATQRPANKRVRSTTRLIRRAFLYQETPACPPRVQEGRLGSFARSLLLSACGICSSNFAPFGNSRRHASERHLESTTGRPAGTLLDSGRPPRAGALTRRAFHLIRKHRLDSRQIPCAMAERSVATPVSRP